MKTLLLIATLSLFARCASAAFFPLSFAEKSEKADLVVHATVVSITKLMPKTDPPGSYMGAHSIALVRVESVLKQRGIGSERRVIPQHIMVPCDYAFREYPSDLTEGRAYIMFLRDMTANLYHPLDPASTHVVHDNLVAEFGMNHSPEMKSPVPGKESFSDRSIPFEQFKKRVLDTTKLSNRPQLVTPEGE